MLPKHKAKRWGASKHELSCDRNGLFDRPKSDEQMDRKRIYCSARWKRLRRHILNQGPLCVACEAKGRVVAAHAIDHIVPVQDAPERAYDEDNLQPLCHACHNAKTFGEITQRRRDNAKYPRSPIPHPDIP